MTESAAEREHKRRLRAALDGVALNPEQTMDDVAPLPETVVDESKRDEELDANRPPHHAG